MSARITKKEGLNSKREKVVPIAAFTANDNWPKLKTALGEGLDAGLTVSEIKEVLVQMYAYCGFPRSLNAIHAFMEVLEERKRRGLRDEPGKEAGPLPAGMNKDEYGAKVRAVLAGQDFIPAPSGYQLFAPVIDGFLKEHLFADIFARDILDYQERELATISALAAMKGTRGQLRFHLGAAMNAGLTEAEMRDFISVLKSKVGRKEADNASEILAEILSARQAPRVVGPRAGVRAPKKEEGTTKTISVARGGSRPASKGEAEYFTGSVRIEDLFQAGDPLRASGGRVTFQPGARTAWHSHPYGQILIVTDGVGWVRQWGRPVEEIKQGDVVRIPPGIKHWHGATATAALTHIAIQEPFEEKAAEWMEHVSDEQYRGGSSDKARRRS